MEIEDFESLSAEILFEKLDGVLFYIRDLINLVFVAKLDTICKTSRLFEILSSTSLRRLLSLPVKEKIIRYFYYFSPYVKYFQ